MVNPLPLYSIPLPLLLLVGAIFTLLAGYVQDRTKIKGIREIFSFSFLLLSLFAAYMMYEQVKANGILLVEILPFPPPAGACFEIDMLSIFMAVSAILLGLFSSVFSFRYMEKDTRLTEYYSLLLFTIAGIVGVAFAGDLFTLFVFWELMSISAYVLVAFRKERWAPIEAGFKYLIMSSFGSAVIFIAMSFLYGMSGTLNLAHLSSILRGEISPWLHITLAMLIIGFGIKTAIVPLHTWLPDAHPEAPSPISALLSGIIIQTGLYAMCRVLYLLFATDIFSLIFIALSILTMTVGNFLALLQDDIKRLLAYSSIAQIGYMLIGLAVGTSLAFTGTFLHVFNHALMKGLAFLAAGAIWHSAETRSLAELKGVGRSMPITTMALTISFLGLIGVPSTAGFISKFLYLFRSTFEANIAWLGIIGFLNSVFSVAYYLRTLQILLGTPTKKVPEAPLSMLAPMCAMAFLIIFFGILPNWPIPILDFASKASEALIDIRSYTSAVIT